VNFNPALLLLDEPDAHLHPNNQRMIAVALRKIASGGHTNIILATHSRTMLDAFERVGDASFVWIENGEVQSEHQKDRISMLMMEPNDSTLPSAPG
jgi:predicted ATP-dependent endonuclease of OLD family